jgi:dTDP-4-amino-4,6-dideoxygalactose transaminase
LTDRLPLVDLAAQRDAIAGELGAAVERALARTDWILGAEVAEFESEFAAYCGVEGAAGVDCGMSALELSLRALDVGPGDEVITAANTFIATAFAISNAGATPVLVDADPDRYTIEPALVEQAITGRTKAIVPVHLYGQLADMEALLAIADRHGLVVVEDACQAHGARLDGRRAGSFGDAAAFSFYPSKNLGAFGDGGIVVSNNELLLERVRLLRNYGQREKYRHDVVGFNRRLDTIQAAMLRTKLPHLDSWNARRRDAADLYGSLLTEIEIAPPSVASAVESVWHLYVIEVEHRDELRVHLGQAGIDTGIHYPVPIHLQPAYMSLGHTTGAFPVSERAAHRIVSLPMYPELSSRAIERVVDVIADFGGNMRATA